MGTLVRPYCTLEDVRNECKNSTTDNDELYLRCINLASSYVEDVCGRDFSYHDNRVTPFRVPRNQVLGTEIILRWPIISITDVRMWYDPLVQSSSDFSLNPNEYYFDVGSSLISLEPYYDWRGGWSPIPQSGSTGYTADPAFWNGSIGLSSLNPTRNEMGLGYPFRGIIEVTGEFGYPPVVGDTDLQLPSPNLPAVVRRAATIVAAAWSYQKSVQQVGLDGSTVNLLDNRVSLEVKDLLDYHTYIANSSF